MIFVIYNTVPSYPPAAIAPHLTIEQQQENKKSDSGRCRFLIRNAFALPERMGTDEDS
jgi:hypothetical protein